MLNEPLPLWFDIGHRPYIVLGGQHKLGVQHPLGLVIQTRGGMDLYDLVVLDRQVVASALQMGNLLNRAHTLKFHVIYFMI